MTDQADGLRPGGVLACLIIGSGFSGIAMAIRCRQAGIAPFHIVEKGEAIGGTWRDNTYPGAACDIPSHLYSLSFAPKPDWSRIYPRQPEIEAYLRETVEGHGLREHIALATTVTAATWDEARALWRVTTDRGPIEARVVVSGMGALHHPAFPKLPGLGSFKGRTFHSARWEHDCDLAGKRVGVIGTGASTVQFLPAIASAAAHVTLFQRTPPYVMPRGDRPFSRREKAAFGRIPALRKLYRASLFWSREARALLGFTKVSRLTALGEVIARRHLAKAVPDAALRAKLTPAYRLGCKRVLVSDDYYPTLMRPNVSLEVEPIARVEPDGIVTGDGARHPLDVLVFGTGFEVAAAFARFAVTGRGGRTLGQAWHDGAEAFQGVSVTGFPNFFLLMGPNTGLGHNSVIAMIEAQVSHVLGCLLVLRERGARTIEVRAEAQVRFLEGVRTRLAGSIWQTGGCLSWYLDERGRNTTLWPGTVIGYRRGARRVDLADYRLS